VRAYPDCPEQPAILKYVGRDETGSIRWQLSGDPARTYLVEGSTNLLEWTALTTVQPVDGMADFNDPNSGSVGFRFYRALLVP
jgi:hypothetical protein